MTKTYFNPPALFNSLQYGFSQIVVARGGATVYLSGQVGWDAQQQIIGAGDLAAQARQALKNIATAMQAAGGSLADVVSLRIYFVDDALTETRHISAALKEFFPAGRAPATTWIGVRSLANASILIEIEAIGVIE